jgi:glycosyltransferase involved in cell wall biosynthesis
MSVVPNEGVENQASGHMDSGAANSLLEQRHKIAVIIPCFNEGHSIAEVVRGFRAVLPNARIYVFDNNSTDETIAIAGAAGALVRRETLQGKGHVVRRMFADVDADAYVMVDGDSTYDPSYATQMVNRLFEEHLDMVVGTRVASNIGAYPLGHRFGNRLFTFAVANLFGERFSDMLSGYRVFSRRFVKSFPAMSSGFEIETELTIHALELQLPVAEVATPYRIRVTGSASKLRTYVDGLRIVRLIVVLYKNERPFRFFSAIAGAFIAVALALGIPLVVTFIKTGLVLRQPTAILATGFVLLSALSFVSGLILDTVTRGRREMRRLAYLALPPPDRE